MKKFTLVIFLFIAGSVFSQNFDITKGQIFKDKKKNSKLLFALNDEKGGLITIRSYYGGLIIKTLKGYYIQHFDAELNLQKEYELKVKQNRIENAFVKNGELHLIEFNKSRIKRFLKYNALTTSLESFNFKSKELLSLSEDNFKKYFEVMAFPFFINNGIAQLDSDHLGSVTMSKNNNFFAINFDIKNKDKETHKVFVYNDSLELVYHKLVVKPIKDRYFDYNTIAVDDKDGALYFLGKSYENKSRRKKKKGKTNYHFELSKIDESGEKIVSFKNPDKFISSLSLIKNEDGEIQYMYGVSQDITATKQYEQSIKVAKQRTEALLRVSELEITSLDDFFKKTLKEMKRLSSSDKGYIFKYNTQNKKSLFALIFLVSFAPWLI